MSKSSKPSLKQSGRVAALSLGALGIVYGDIGTSPLYAVRESFVTQDIAVVEENVLGVLSLIFWSLLIVISIKYLLVVMRADNDGEGGILALVALVAPRQQTTTGRRWVLIVVGLFGTALLYGDGMITPAISVLSATEGIHVATPALEPFVVPISVIILIGLFLIQRHGTGTVGRIFGPVMIVWFLTMAVLGIGQLIKDPGVFVALNPIHGIRFFSNNGFRGFLALGSVFLVVTGSEALYADMGHFGRTPIRITWYGLVLPSLVLTYFGQGAFLIANPEAVSNPFYLMAPSWAVWPLVILATFATVIASQALISGAFSLTMQAVQLGYLPRIRIFHTSASESGQVYIPAINWALMVAAVGLVVGFGSASALAAAYGIAVSTTMVVTTVLILVVMRDRWNWSIAAAAAVTGAFLVVDLAYFGANLFKIPDGGWFPILIAAVIFVAMTTWKKGRQLLAARLRETSSSFERFIASVSESEIVRVPGTAVYMFSRPGVAPPALLANLRHNEVLHERVVVLSVLTAAEPRVPVSQRAKVWPLGNGFFQIVLRFGFMEKPDVPEALSGIIRNDFGFDSDDTVWVLGRETVLATRRPGMMLWREKLFALMARNASLPSRYFHLPPDRSLEIGIHVEI
ncbi:MAG: potassium transporter Kup [Actinomycetia bacterium]|nr:potassium transporter Kup [Actinomycetes bacterium]